MLAYAFPKATWLAAFSSRSVEQKTVPRWPISALAGRRARPRRGEKAPTSRAQRSRTTAAFSSASISTARPPSKRTRSPRTVRAGHLERPRRANDRLDPNRVWRGRDLLGREIGTEDDPVDGGRRAALELRGGEEADREVRARPLEVERVEPPLGQPAGGSGERGEALVPRRGRIGLVEPAHVRDLLPEPRRARRRRRARDAPPPPRRASGTGTTVQFVVRALITGSSPSERASGPCRRAPGRGRPARPAARSGGA